MKKLILINLIYIISLSTSSCFVIQLIEYLSNQLITDDKQFHTSKYLSRSVKSAPANGGNYAARTIQGYGYPVESHEIETEDGYLLTAHRIPHGKKPSKGIRPAVLLHHGILTSSDCWVLRGPNIDLAFILADNGYDVWLMNVRGNYYSRKHIFLNPDRNKEFWEYSFHEIGYYDLPATIDYILNKTNQESLHFIGHSMGGTVFFVMCTTRPEYNSKIKLMQGLAAAVYFVRKPTPLLQYVIQTEAIIEAALESQNYFELFPLKNILGRIAKVFCHDRAPTQPICLSLIFMVTGLDKYKPFEQQQFNSSILPVASQYFPAGTSLKQFRHFMQCLKNGNFQQLGSDVYTNNQTYQQKEPQVYELKKVKAPVALYYSTCDYIVTREDTKKLARQLPNLVGTFKIPYINHLDFLWGVDVKLLLYDKMLELMKHA